MGERTLIAGILNVNPDSFSDGGTYLDIDNAVKYAKHMLEAGADIIDIGGESTRPGYEPVSIEVELSRVLPVIKRLREETKAVISIDTQKAEVARQALIAGAHIVNDILGLQGDPDMARVVAEFSAGIIVMHNSKTGEYTDVIQDMKDFFSRSLQLAAETGIDESRIVLDPGIGFAKTFENNIDILSRLEELNSFGLPVLLGTSRKRFIGTILDKPVLERLEGSLATAVLGIAKGVDILRVHDVEEIKRATKVTDVIIRRN